MLARRRGRIAALAILTLLAGPEARAHVVYGTATLSQLTRDADVIARVRIVDPRASLVLEDPPLRRPTVEVSVLEVLKGDVAKGPLTYVPHGHGVAEYTAGQEVLLFLQRIERNPELASTRLAGAMRWVSTQESADEIVLSPAARESYVAAVRAYVAVERLPTREARIEGLRQITLKLLASREPKLASSAVRDVALAASAPLITKADLPRVAPLLGESRVAITTRIALLAELERRQLVVGPDEWVKLLERTTGNDLLAVIRAVAAHPSPSVTRTLVPMLRNQDEALAAAAAVSLGSPGNEEAVDPLAQLLANDDQRLRMAAIRGLGRIGTAGSRRVLEVAAVFHPDQATRRRANAEVIVLARRQGTTLGDALAP